MTLLQTIFEVFPRYLTKLVDICKICKMSRVTFDPKPHKHYLNSLCSQKQILLVKKATIDPGCYDSFNI